MELNCTALINYEIKKQRAVITLASPRSGNTVNKECLDAIKHAVINANEDKDIRLIVLRGKEGVFCKGMDFSILFRSENIRDFTTPYMETVLEIRNSEKPVLCIIDGEVLAGGLGLLCASDIVLCTERSTFGLSEIYFGLIPAYVFPLLIERVPFKRARYLALSARKFNARDALIYGLVDEIIPPGKEEGKLREYQQRILFSSPAALGLLKKYSDDIFHHNLAKSMLTARDRLESLLLDNEITEAIRKFQQGEPLPWSISYKKGGQK